MKIGQIRYVQAYLILLYFANTTFFTNGKFVATFCPTNLLARFPTVFVHFFSLSHFGNSQNSSYFFIRCDLWSMIFDAGFVIVLEYRKPRSYRTADLINVVCILTAPPMGCSPVSLRLLLLPYTQSHGHIEIKPVNNPTMPFKCW